MNFDKYKNTVPYPDSDAFRNKLLADIDKQPMTAQERLDAIARVDITVRDWFREAVKPHNNREYEIMADFWADCRKDIGYDKFLTVRQCKVLQGYAWERGHSGGYHEVYNCLLDLAEFVKDLMTP